MRDQTDEFERLTPGDARAAEPSSGGRAPRVAERIDDVHVELHPRGVGAVLDLGLDLIRQRFAVCFGLATLLWIPMRYLGSFLQPDPLGYGSQDPAVIFGTLGYALLGYAVLWTTSTLVSAYTAGILFETVNGREADVGRSVRRTVARFPGIIVLNIVSGLLIMAGLVMCILPVLGVVWLVTPLVYVYVLEDVGVGTALRRSFALSCGQLFSWPSFFAFWRWFGILMVSSYLVFPLSTLASVMEMPQARDWILEMMPMSSVAYEAISILLGSVLLGLATTIQASVFTAYYLDCRIRRDGLDLGTWLGRLHASGGTPDVERTVRS